MFNIKKAKKVFKSGLKIKRVSMSDKLLLRYDILSDINSSYSYSIIDGFDYNSSPISIIKYLRKKGFNVDVLQHETRFVNWQIRVSGWDIENKGDVYEN